MSGWLALFGKIDNFEPRLRKFERVFSVENVPSLLVETTNHSNFGLHNSSFIPHNSSFKSHPSSFTPHNSKFISVLWSWRERRVSSIEHQVSNEFPDVNTYSDNNGNVLMLCGAVTDLGRYGSVTSNQHETAKTILNLWHEHGDSIVDQLNGSWCLLFYNSKENVSTAFTDRFASRSVWLSWDNGTWIIGNFPSAIVSMRQNTTTYDPAGLWSLFMTSRHIPGKSLYTEVFSLIAGQKVVLMPDNRHLILDWYKRRYKPDYSITAKEWGYRLAHALRNSAKNLKRITPDAHLFLSGGLDSRIAAAAYGDDLSTVTLCSAPNFESRVANLVSNRLGLEHQTIIRSPYWYLDTLSASALITSGNYLLTHAHFIVPTKDIIQNSPDACFMLGDLLENLNKHYFSIPKGAFFSFNSERLPDLLVNFIPATSRNPHQVSSIFNADSREELRESWIETIRESAKLVMDVSEDDCDKFDTYLRWVDASVTYTYNMITCLWPFARERTLFFDNELNDLSLQIPANIRGKGILHQWLLWNLDKTLLLIPDANNFLPTFAPRGLQNMAKQLRPKLGHLRRSLFTKTNPEAMNLPTAGSWPLFNELYRRDKRYQNMIATLFGDNFAFPQEIFNHNEIQKIWREFLSGNLSLLFDVTSLISFGALNRLIPCVKTP